MEGLDEIELQKRQFESEEFQDADERLLVCVTAIMIPFTFGLAWIVCAILQAVARG